jgi:hypothetical protein
MAKYRVYEVETDGRLLDSEGLICANDEQAIEAASHFFQGSYVEIWSGSRLVIWMPDDCDEVP